MSDNRKYYYMTSTTTRTMVILECRMACCTNLLLKMYLMSLKSGGILMLNDHLPHAPDHRHLYPPSGGDGGTALRIWPCGDFDRWSLLHGRHPTADRPILYRGEKERAYAIEASKLLPSGGAFCPPYSQGTFVHQRLEIRD